eukprot:CAMPEP_0194309144 /NCGR_PEP_ID=MMETSP0171-20130528/6126_1 /TAXON_ID=218684 /ORGANISM="Corethron pennatum, Strain L29A3" /LENGTH=31 /DNA_ID= /DNA_START= /DNA_END= /DNA_ORIENTATION=
MSANVGYGIEDKVASAIVGTSVGKLSPDGGV